MFIVAAMAVMLIGATALATEDAFADKKKYSSKSQAVSQVNDCDNGGEDHERPNGISTMDEDPIEIGGENIGCQNTASEIQGDYNSAALASEQVFDD